MQAGFILLDFPGVRVAVDVSLNLLARADDLEESLGIFQPHIAAEAGVMVDHNDSRRIGILIERFGQPGELFVSQKSWRRQRLLERIENEPIRSGSFHEAALAI